MKLHGTIGQMEAIEGLVKRYGSYTALLGPRGTPQWIEHALGMAAVCTYYEVYEDQQAVTRNNGGAVQDLNAMRVLDSETFSFRIWKDYRNGRGRIAISRESKAGLDQLIPEAREICKDLKTDRQLREAAA